MPRFLADSSIWGWANSGRRPDIRAKLATRFERGEVVTCAPVVLEALHRPRTGAGYDRLLIGVFEPLPWLPLTGEVARRAVDIQRSMAQISHGNHLWPAVDYLVAATAEIAGAAISLWFFDRDLELICEHTGQPYEAEQSGA